MKSSVQSKVLRRLKLAQGQLVGLANMVREGRYCVDIIIQSSAVKEALSGVEHLLLENHLSTHVVEQMKNGKRKRAIEEMMKVYKLAQRKR